MTKGKIFDIRRFSTHDGDGIRTTIFFKGCPLHCVWCQNPEGMDRDTKIIYLENKCIHCGSCLKVAMNNEVYVDNGKICINQGDMENWEHIIKECPTGALTKDTMAYTASALVKEILRDEIFFKNGGGITLSGGEPLMQAVFASEVLQYLKERGIHTAIETALGVSTSQVELVLPYLDQIYADLKIYNEVKHKQYVGLSNVLIKKNLRMLLTSDYKDKVIVRTPLIPNFTATEENLAAISMFLSEIYPDVKYELLNYNPLAEAKYHLVERSYCFEKNPKMYSKEQMIAFGEIAKQNGIKNLILEI